ncbi:MAG: LacI family DNA-binding transcriptional regulator [Thermomicrobiales bacterium]
MRAVADLAGVSTATVSHVINETRAVSPPLMARVLDAMEQLDYQPDVVARSLRRRETLTIGLVLPSVEIPFYASVAESVQEAADTAGYSIILCSSGWALERELHHLRLLLARRVDGLLCISLGMTAGHLAAFLRRGVPVVQFERSMPGLEIDAVEIDNFQGAYDATAHLVALGHRRIGCITGLPNSILNETRLRAFRQALESAGLAADPEMIREGDYTTASGMRETGAMLALEKPPTAIFAFNDLMALGAMRIAQERGRRIPDDLAIIGFDGLPLTADLFPPLSTVVQPVPEMGAAAISMLLERIGDSALGEARVRTFPARVVARASTLGFGIGEV